MRAAARIVLTEEDRKTLVGLVRAATSPQRTVRRANVVLRAADGLTNEEIAAELKVGINAAGKWRRRYASEGLAGITRDKRGRGRKPSVSKETVDEIVRRTREEMPPGRTHWSRSSMAAAMKVSESTVGRVWSAHGLQPHRVETFKVSRDRLFSEKLDDVVGLYLSPPANAVVFSTDEKSQIQALDRTQPGLPLKKGRAGTMTHDYKRYGTTTLFAALNVATGAVFGMCQPRHTHVEWLQFLRRLERETPKDKGIHVIADNYATHKHPKVKAWLARNPRVVMHFTPTSTSWLNMVERFFRDLTVNAIRRGVFTSVHDLIDAIDAYLVEHNRAPKPFIWTASAKDILAKVVRAQEALRLRIAAQKGLVG